MRSLKAVAVSPTSLAARRKFRCCAAAKKQRKLSIDGNGLGICFGVDMRWSFEQR
jgi:hypothetical protein